MRYVIAMIFAAAAAAIAFKFFSGHVADWAVSTMKFESPDQNDTWHDLTFMVCNVIGLVVGWIIGWGVGGAVAERGPQAP